MSNQLSPESQPPSIEVNLTDEQKMQLENLTKTLNELEDFINNNPKKIPELINNSFRPKEEILPYGQKFLGLLYMIN
jgi:hypothetical protein